MAQEYKERIKENIDLKEFLSTKGIVWSDKGSVPKALCMFHDEKTPSFTLSRDLKRYRCFGCNESGDIFDFLMSYEKLSFTESIKQLSNYLSWDYDENTFIDDSERRKKSNILSKEVFEVNKVAQSYFLRQLNDQKSESSRKVIEYLDKRDISASVVNKHYIGFCPDGNLGSLFTHFQSNKVNKRGVMGSNLLFKSEDNNEWVDFFRNRITIAILDENSNIVGFAGRSVNDSQKSKYINSKDSEVFNKSQILYGLDRASENIKLKSQAVVVEGYFDCISGYEKGYLNLVAAMGTQLSADNFDKLKRLVTYGSDSGEIIFCFDNDNAGHKAALDTILKLRENIAINFKKSEKKVNVKVCFPSKGKDPDEIFRTNPLEWEDMINQSKNFIEFLIEYYSEQFLEENNKDTYKFLEVLLPFIIESCDENQQSFYLRKISKLTELDYDLLNMEAKTSMKSKYRRSNKNLQNDQIIKRVIFNPEKSQEKHFLALIYQNPELFDSVKDIEDVYFSDLHFRSIFNYWKKENKVSPKEEINDDLVFIYEELSNYLDEGFVSDPDFSLEIELENVKTRLAIDFQKRKLNDTAVRLKEEEDQTDKDKAIIGSLMLEIVEITENIKNLERSEVN